MIKKIVILGGGTAGWLCAGILAAEFRNKTQASVVISLIESPEVSTIGVGEGTWPTMRATLERIGISETTFLTVCSASFKQGSKFVGWRNGAPDDFYYHPFSLPLGLGEYSTVSIWQSQFADRKFDQLANLQARVCEAGLAPKQITTPEYAGALNYGYHLDAGKFGELLRSHCVEELGVEHICDHMTHVKVAPDGAIASLGTKMHGDVEGDLFIDCSGTHCLLLGEHYGVPFVDLSHYSSNDRALAIQVPYAEENAAIASVTKGTARSSGWIWDIGLSSRRGVGYVFSSAHQEKQSAEDELVEYLRQTVGESVLNKLEPRLLQIKAGHRAKFWHKNCVAVGMSAGFIEPLEATALALVELSAAMIRDELPQTPRAMEIVAQRFNALFEYRWQRIVEFLKLHYVLSSRRDTPYWCDAADINRVPDGLQELLELWRYRAPYERDLIRVEEVFPYASYLYVLYGMGYKTQLVPSERASFNAQTGVAAIEQEWAKLDRYIRALPDNRKLLSSIAQYGLKKI